MIDSLGMPNYHRYIQLQFVIHQELPGEMVSFKSVTFELFERGGER